MSNGLTLAQVEAIIREAVQTGAGQPIDNEQVEEAIRQAVEATRKAMEAAQHAEEAYQTTQLVFKSPVADMGILAEAYPSPEIGWTVQTYKDGRRYRFNGETWEEIDIFGQNLQVVNASTDGLMSKAEHLKLNEIPLEVQDRILVFCKESRVYPEIIGVLAPFPFQGEILSIKGYCAVPGESQTVIRIERSKDLVQWLDITETSLIFEAQQHRDNGEATFHEKKVEPGDIFRVHIVEAGGNLQHLTIQLTIRT
nr:hypothetical protein [Paenibacillus xylanexedens]